MSPLLRSTSKLHVTEICHKIAFSASLRTNFTTSQKYPESATNASLQTHISLLRPLLAESPYPTLQQLQEAYYISHNAQRYQEMYENVKDMARMVREIRAYMRESDGMKESRKDFPVNVARGWLEGQNYQRIPTQDEFRTLWHKVKGSSLSRRQFYSLIWNMRHRGLPLETRNSLDQALQVEETSEERITALAEQYSVTPRQIKRRLHVLRQQILPLHLRSQLRRALKQCNYAPTNAQVAQWSEKYDVAQDDLLRYIQQQRVKHTTTSRSQRSAILQYARERSYQLSADDYSVLVQRTGLPKQRIVEMIRMRQLNRGKIGNEEKEILHTWFIDHLLPESNRRATREELRHLSSTLNLGWLRVYNYLEKCRKRQDRGEVTEKTVQHVEQWLKEALHTDTALLRLDSPQAKLDYIRVQNHDALVCLSKVLAISQHQLLTLLRRALNPPGTITDENRQMLHDYFEMHHEKLHHRLKRDLPQLCMETNLNATQIRNMLERLKYAHGTVTITPELREIVVQWVREHSESVPNEAETLTRRTNLPHNKISDLLWRLRRDKNQDITDAKRRMVSEYLESRHWGKLSRDEMGQLCENVGLGRTQMHGMIRRLRQKNTRQPDE